MYGMGTTSRDTQSQTLQVRLRPSEADRLRKLADGATYGK
jgi:hypothetical protein